MNLYTKRKSEIIIKINKLIIATYPKGGQKWRRTLLKKYIWNYKSIKITIRNDSFVWSKWNGIY